MTGGGRRVDVVSVVRNPRTVVVCRVDRDRTDDAARLGVRPGVNALPDDRRRRIVGVVGNENTAGARGDPHRASILGGALNPRDGAAAASRTIDNRRVLLVGQIRGASGPNPDEVTATSFCGACREFRAVRFEQCGIAAPVLRAPDRERTLEDRSSHRRVRVGDDRRVEERRLGTRQDRRRDNHPLRRVAAAEVRIVGLPGERVEAQGVIGRIESGLAAITVDDLGPDIARPVVWKVPLSCVPPWRRFCGRCALTDRLWNCSVDSPLFMLTSLFATRASSRLHKAVSDSSRSRVVALAETSPNLPSDRTTPPSEPVMNCSGLPGTVTIACWSGWMTSA